MTDDYLIKIEKEYPHLRYYASDRCYAFTSLLRTATTVEMARWQRYLPQHHHHLLHKSDLMAITNTATTITLRPSIVRSYVVGKPFLHRQCFPPKKLCTPFEFTNISASPSQLLITLSLTLPYKSNDVRINLLIDDLDNG